MSEFRNTLQHHLNQTRAGLYGQFEHSFNFITGPDQNDLLKIAPGEFITFSGELTNGQVCSLIATNNLSSSSGAGFAAQRTVANSRTIVIPVSPQDGNATLEFSCPTGGGQTEVVSHTVNESSSQVDRWDAIDQTLTRIFTKTGGSTRDIVSSQAGDYYVTSGNMPAIGDGLGEMAVFEANGTFKWRAQIEDVVTLASSVAYDEGSEVVGVMQIEDSGRGTVKLVGYDASLNVDQGGVSEPPPLYETAVVRNLSTALYDCKADGNGSFIVAARRNDEWDGAAGEFAVIWKIDAATGAILASFDNNGGGFAFLRIAICPVTGNIAVCQTNQSIPDGETENMNVMILDSDLNFLYSDLVPWGTLTGGGNFTRHIMPTFDSTGRVYLMTTKGFMVRYSDGTLAVRDLEVDLFPTNPNMEPFSILDIGHNLNGNVILSAGGPAFNNTSHIFHYDNNGVFVSDYLAPGPSGNLAGAVHVRPASGPGPDLGAFFTQEKSMTPPGRQRAVVAVKYAAGNITGIFFNSVEVEFDHTKWTAEHSVYGQVDISASAPGWEYNSPL